jgi:hypothetical protein
MMCASQPSGVPAVPHASSIRLACLLSSLTALSGPALAARGTLYSYNGGGNIADQSAPGFVSVDSSNSARYGRASGSEFTGGVGVFTSASSSGQNMQAQASAGYSTTMTVSCPLSDLEDLICAFDIPMIVSGSVSASGACIPGSFCISAEAGYLFSWRVGTSYGTVSGGGEVHQYFRDNGTQEQVIVGDPFTSYRRIFVDNGGTVTLSMQASAGAFSDSNGIYGSQAVADFEHTLRWGGVSAAYSSSGRLLDLGQVHLFGADGFDYVNAAPPNPFTSQVPEPANWALMAGGIAWLVVRRRRR